nr:hypothetical protein [Tanacetum cinerariifolium]
MSYLTDYEEIDGGYVAFGGNPKEGKITRKGTIKTGNLDFKNVYFVRELKFNLFSVSQTCDKKNNVLFNDTECIILSPNFKLIDESQVLLRVPKKNNMYSVDLKNIVPKGGLTCLFAKATFDEYKLWHRRLGHLNFKTMNKLVKRNLVRGLPSKFFENDQTCVACQKGKQHRAFCKSKTENSISLPLNLLHMDLIGLTFVKSLKKKMYCLVVTDDYSRFIWVFFLATNNETSGILMSFITGIENLVDHKGILRQFSVARTPQQNRVVERRNRTLIEAARTMLADFKLPTTFWVEVVNVACYVQNRVLVVKPHNKTPYKNFHGRTPTLSFMRPFGYLITILNTIDHLGKFNGKADEGFFIGYSLNSKSFRVFNSRTRIVEENLHIRFSESTHNDVGSEPDWLFDIDALTRTMNYEPIIAGTQFNGFVGTKASDNAGQARKETEHVKDYILLSLWTADLLFSQDLKSSNDDGYKPSSDDEKKVDEDPRKENECNDQEKKYNVNNTNNVNTANNSNTVSSTVNTADTNGVNTELCIAFKKLMHEKFQMSSIGEVTFFLGLKVKQKKIGTFISQDKYVAEILKKFRFTEVKTASTPMETQKPLLKDEDGEEVDVYMYRYQVNLKVLHFHIVKRIFRASLDMKSTIGGCQLLRCRLISWQCKKQTVVTNSTTEVEYFWSTAMAKTINGEAQLHAKVDGKKIIISESSIRRVLRLADKEGIDCLPNSTIFEQIALMGERFSGKVTHLFQTMVQQLGEGSAIPTDPQHTPTIIQPLSSQSQKIQKPRKPKRNNTQIPQPSGPTKSVADEAVYKELGVITLSFPSLLDHTKIIRRI